MKRWKEDTLNTDRAEQDDKHHEKSRPQVGAEKHPILRRQPSVQKRRETMLSKTK